MGKHCQNPGIFRVAPEVMHLKYGFHQPRYICMCIAVLKHAKKTNKLLGMESSSRRWTNGTTTARKKQAASAQHPATHPAAHLASPAQCRRALLEALWLCQPPVPSATLTLGSPNTSLWSLAPTRRSCLLHGAELQEESAKCTPLLTRSIPRHPTLCFPAVPQRSACLLPASASHPSAVALPTLSFLKQKPNKP